MPKNKLGPQARAMLEALGKCYRNWKNRFPWSEPTQGVQWAILEAVRAAQAVEERPRAKGWHDVSDLYEEPPKVELPPSTTHADGGILFCTICGTALGDANQDDTESMGVKS